jgi:hypothetical protein
LTLGGVLAVKGDFGLIIFELDDMEFGDYELVEMSYPQTRVKQSPRRPPVHVGLV